MKGLLHRLAARAAGSALPVRSDARLPFGGGLAWADEPLDAHSGTVRDSLPAAVAAWPDVTPDRVDPEPTRTTAATSTATSTEVLVEAIAAPSPEPIHQRPTVAPPELVPQAAPPPAPRPPVGEPHDGARGEPAGLDAVPPPAAGTTDPLDERKPAIATAHHPDGASRRAKASTTGEPARLMPSTRVRVDASTPISAPTAQSLDDTTEVHIHIGRIDVTAVRDAPAPRTPSRERKSPLSLDAYLAARRKP